VTRRTRLLEVRSKEWLTPRMLRLVLGSEELADFGAGEFTDHYVKLQLPPAGAGYEPPFEVEEIRASRPREQWPRTRTYTVSAWDPERLELTVDFVVHGDSGVAAPWARDAEVGESLQVLGPGGAYAPAADVEWHLMVGDPSALPAISASLARVAAGRPVRVLAQVAGAEDELPLRSPGELEVSWIHTAGDEALVEALRALEFPPGPYDAFVHGEAAAVRAVRRHLAVERGLPLERLSASGYWKRTRTEEGWREDKAEWKRLAEADVAGTSGQS
jgi:NADPH-dependent ferric siderophore reductase